MNGFYLTSVVKKLMQLTNYSIQSLPFPGFILDKDMNVLAATELAIEQFPSITNFMEVIDLGSKKKFTNFFTPSLPLSNVEITLLNKQNKLLLYDIHIVWETEDRVNVFCVEKQNYIEQIKTMISKLEDKLSRGSLSLQEEQGEIRKMLKRMEHIVTMSNDNFSNFTKLTQTIALDLQKPLLKVRGFLQLMQPTMNETGNSHYASIALDEINVANNLIYQYLNTNTPSAPNKERFNIQKAMDDMIATIKHDAIKVNCDIKHIKESILPVINADVQQIQQVLVNIIHNGIEAIQNSPNRGKGLISIRTRLCPIDEKINISITDNGKGISNELVNKIFVPFYTTKDKGAGIGLAISKIIIEQHNGSIFVDEPSSVGTRFVIILPINK